MKAHRFTQKAHTGAESNNYTFSAKGAYNAFKRLSGGERMKNKYPISRKDKQQQIENLLKVYDFLGRQNRKKELPKNNKNTERIDRIQGVKHEVQR